MARTTDRRTVLRSMALGAAALAGGRPMRTATVAAWLWLR